MATLIIAIGLVGFLLMFVVTLALVALNFSEKTLAPVLTILLVGTATTLAGVLLTLKKSTVESAFTTSVVLDTTDGTPPLIISEPNNPKLTSRLSELARLSHPMVNRDGKPTLTIENPTSDGERFTFGGELLQYQLLHAVRKLQRGSWSIGYFYGASTATVSLPMKVSDVQDYPTEAILSVVHANRFSHSDMERFGWEHVSLPLPKNTTPSLLHQVTSPSTGPERHILRLEKPMFFQLDFVVEPMGATGMGVLPNGLNLAPDLAARCQTYQFKITMHANFEWITAGNSRTQEYKDWANWLFSSVKDNLGD